MTPTDARRAEGRVTGRQRHVLRLLGDGWKLYSARYSSYVWMTGPEWTGSHSRDYFRVHQSTCNALINRKLIETIHQPGYTANTQFKITDAGRAALAAHGEMTE